MTDNVSIFEENVTEIVSGAINTSIDGVDENREGWKKFEAELVKLIVAEAQRAFVQHAAVKSEPTKTKAVPKSKPKTDSNSEEGSGSKRIYSQWVKGLTRIRRGEVMGDDMITVGDHFTSKTSKSVAKYNNVKDHLRLEGQDMSVRTLMDKLKSCPGLSGEKDLVITAIAWGLIPVTRREELALRYA